MPYSTDRDFMSHMGQLADAVRVVLVLLAVIFGGWALVHWLTPCEPGHLCLFGAALTPTRRPPHRRLWCALRALYLRFLLRSAERDIEWHRMQADLAPQLATLAERRAGQLRVRLIDLQ